MSTAPEQPLARGGLGRELSPVGQHCALWLRFLARAVKMSRLYRGENSTGNESRQLVWEQLTKHLQEFGKWNLRVTSTEIKLDEEVVVRQSPRESLESGIIPGPEEALPFTLYRDGVRGLLFTPQATQREFDAVFGALVDVGQGANSQDDLVTLLWQANLRGIVIDSVPLEQTIYLSSRRPPRTGRRGFRGQSFVWAPSGSEIRGDLGAVVGPQGLHRDTFDDWRLPDVVANSVQAYQALFPKLEEAKQSFLAQWEEERAEDWTRLVPPMFRGVLELSNADDTRHALSQAIATWLADALQRADWEEAGRAHELLREMDPELKRAHAKLAELIEEIECQPIAERLDESKPEEQARFAALVVALGRVGMPLAIEVMSLCERARPRAAATSALTYLCADEPRLLEPFLEDTRWYVVRNVVFVLGHIGGTPVLEMLRTASLHPEVRVQREVVRALGSVSRAERTPLLIQQLRSRDPQLLAATLHMLTRERNERVTRAIVDRIAQDDFADLTEENQRAFLGTLAEIADETTVPALERLLNRASGWFARRTLWRDAAARILQRIGNERALAILEAGLKSKSEPVRAACLAAMEIGGRPAA